MWKGMWWGEVFYLHWGEKKTRQNVFYTLRAREKIFLDSRSVVTGITENRTWLILPWIEVGVPHGMYILPANLTNYKRLKGGYVFYIFVPTKPSSVVSLLESNACWIVCVPLPFIAMIKGGYFYHFWKLNRDTSLPAAYETYSLNTNNQLYILALLLRSLMECSWLILLAVKGHA